MARGEVFAVIAGGGTAGHVVPGLALGAALVERGHRADSIRFVGSERGMEARLVPAAGFALTVLPGRGIRRSLTLANVAAVAGLVRACARAVGLLRRWRPAVVVSLGGFASVPCVLAAVLWRVPIVVVSYDAVPGLASRLAARFARASAVAMDGVALPRAVVTGTPVRQELLAIGRHRRPPESDPDGQAKHVLVVGGSLGAARLNTAVLELVAKPPVTGLNVHHVTGERNYADVTTRAAPAAGVGYHVVAYEDRMDLAYARAAVAVARSGATTVAELAAVGLPSVLVPYPHATGDHQTANAAWLAAAGAAVVVPDAELTTARLSAELAALFASPERLQAMGAAARSLASEDAADRVAALVEQAAAR